MHNLLMRCLRLTDGLTIRMTRMRMYALIDAFERDMRDIFNRYVLSELTPEEALGAGFDRASERKSKDSVANPDAGLVEFIDFHEVYDLLNRHRSLIPSRIAEELRLIAADAGSLTTIRNRVMHGRPLAQGDPQSLVSLLNLFSSPQWQSLAQTSKLTRDDPLWEPPGEATPSDYGVALHNLPLADYDETGLIGRSTDVNKLVAMCKRGRENVITITGEGGIGKTALVLDVAYQLADDQDRPFDAILWSSLKTERLTAEGVREIRNAVTTLTGAANTLALAVESGPVSTFQELGSLLEGLKTLIIIDNLETVNSTSFIDMYEAMPAEVRFLLTSRNGIGEVERRYPLGSLSERDSIQLLIDLATSRNVNALRRISKPTRIEIVNKLRRSPLAIKWFVLAVEAGREPLTLIRNQAEVLEFCVRSVYDSLSQTAQETLHTLFALVRAVTVDEVVLLSGHRVDDVSRSIKELTRGSLVQVSALPQGDGIFTVSISESASQFLRQASLTRPDFVNEIVRRDEEFRTDEERRVREAGSRSLAPVVVRTRDASDSATAQLLRRALLDSQSGKYAEARKLIESARSLNPEFWEVDRVEAFILAAQGDHASATSLYRRAYRLSEGEHRGVVAHFLAGHISRNLKDPDTAHRYAREAHDLLGLDETAIALGNQLIWTHKYEEGIQLIEPTLSSAVGKTKLIAVTCLIEGHRRYAESINDDDRLPLVAFQEAWKGFSVAEPFLTYGTIDYRLVNSAGDSAGQAIKYLCLAVDNGLKIPFEIINQVTEVGPFLPRLLQTPRGSFLAAKLERLSRVAPTLSELVQIQESPIELDSPQTVTARSEEKKLSWIVPNSETRFAGSVLSIPTPNYAFITHADFAENLFFHVSDCSSSLRFNSMKVGDSLTFRVEERNGRLRAVDVDATVSDDVM